MPETRILKVSVIATGELLLNGDRITVAELEDAIRHSGEAKLIVWYYRENAADEPSSLANEVLKLITEHKLPIRLSSRPDFSDSITNVAETLEQIFASVRKKAAEGQLVILRPDGRQVKLPALSKGPPEAMAAMEKLPPSSPDISRVTLSKGTDRRAASWRA